MSDAPFRVAVVGIDGSGKSSVVERLRERSDPAAGLVTMHAPAYHEQPDAPLARLSRQMQAVSLACDMLRLPGLKAAVLYLQMTMYGAVERALVDAFDARFVVSDRHATVDTFAYGPIYRRLLDGPDADGAACQELVRLLLAGDPDDPLAAVAAWHDRRGGDATQLCDLGREVVTALAGEPHDVLREFGRRYATELPDVVVMLDVDPKTASLRCAARCSGSRSELHESPAVLAQLREAYVDGLAKLVVARPWIRVHRLDTAGLTVDGALEAVLECVPELPEALRAEPAALALAA